LAELQKETGAAMILVSHDLGVISRVSDRIIVMYAGQVAESGSALQIFTNPTHPYTQGLFSCIPVPGQKERGSELGSIPGVVPSLLGELEGCMFRPRCDLARDACTQTLPFLKISEGHGAWCVASHEELQSRSEKVALV
jgi:peptide/nickel transport system ATP-binding protein